MNVSHVRSIKTSPYEVVFGQRPNVLGIGVVSSNLPSDTPTINSLS